LRRSYRRARLRGALKKNGEEEEEERKKERKKNLWNSYLTRLKKNTRARRFRLKNEH
jgi:hypothetical protein